MYMVVFISKTKPGGCPVPGCNSTRVEAAVFEVLLCVFSADKGSDAAAYRTLQHHQS